MANLLPLSEYVAVYTGHCPVVYIPRSAVMQGHVVVCNWPAGPGGVAHRTSWYIGENNELEHWWVPVTNGEILRDDADPCRVFLRHQPGLHAVMAPAVPKGQPVPKTPPMGPPAAVPAALVPVGVAKAPGVKAPGPAAVMKAAVPKRTYAQAAAAASDVVVPKRAATDAAESGPAMKRPARR
jgi:hypothetical protein